MTPKRTWKKPKKPQTFKTPRRQYKPTAVAAALALHAEGITQEKSGKLVGMDQTAFSRINKRVRERAKEEGIEWGPAIYQEHPEIFEPKPRPGRRLFFSEEEVDKIFDWVIGSPERRKMPTSDIIKQLNVEGSACYDDGTKKPISQSRFNDIMYKKGYRREKGEWKPYLGDAHREPRDTSAYLTFPV
ncbi:uncharacterized protein KY384_001204 [Bacidia gigantensis]|uniref:uncharacterized protein n=1 Tax=Bacidia gigantensis TaxID=2732470 RepID=UPI001D05BE52|nr:uncharacterized protein KY384_001204 [Bacidia gigantensis]KAG8534360.1 hypothetical protein KY384_001204 [Bacidia gigantensis]